MRGLALQWEGVAARTKAMRHGAAKRAATAKLVRRFGVSISRASARRRGAFGARERDALRQSFVFGYGRQDRVARARE